MTGVFRAITAIILFLPAIGLAQSAVPPQASSPVDRMNEADYIHYGDLIDVDVIGSTEYDWRGTLNPEGFLDGMERLDEPVYALCRSVEDVAMTPVPARAGA